MIFDACGYSREASPAEALNVTLAKSYVGIGHKKRIRYIRPEHAPILWRGSSRNQTQRIRNDKGEIIAPDFHVEFKPLARTVTR
ncbi:MAG: hypothetical protein KJZ78_14395 [Bryobacteraceae bacterium]|nr:hypothetical protein [Bryobacteraceae bacterium]